MFKTVCSAFSEQSCHVCTYVNPRGTWTCQVCKSSLVRQAVLADEDDEKARLKSVNERAKRMQTPHPRYGVVCAPAKRWNGSGNGSGNGKRSDFGFGVPPLRFKPLHMLVVALLAAVLLYIYDAFGFCNPVAPVAASGSMSWTPATATAPAPLPYHHGLLLFGLILAAVVTGNWTLYTVFTAVVFRLMVPVLALLFTTSGGVPACSYFSALSRLWS